MRRRICWTGKVPHRSLRKARIHLRRLTRHRNLGLEISIYRCRHCGQYHLGHTLFKRISAEKSLRWRKQWQEPKKWRWEWEQEEYEEAA